MSTKNSSREHRNLLSMRACLPVDICESVLKEIDGPDNADEIIPLSPSIAAPPFTSPPKSTLRSDAPVFVSRLASKSKPGKIFRRSPQDPRMMTQPNIYTQPLQGQWMVSPNNARTVAQMMRKSATGRPRETLATSTGAIQQTSPVAGKSSPLTSSTHSNKTSPTWADKLKQSARPSEIPPTFSKQGSRKFNTRARARQIQLQLFR